MIIGVVGALHPVPSASKSSFLGMSFFPIRRCIYAQENTFCYTSKWGWFVYFACELFIWGLVELSEEAEEAVVAAAAMSKKKPPVARRKKC